MTARTRRTAQFVEQVALVLVVAIPVALVVVFVLYQNGYFNSTPNAPFAQTKTQAVEPPAALSVDNASALPHTVLAGQIVPFSFTIQNQGNANATYQYKVSVTWGSGESDVIDVNSISLSAGASQSIPESLKFETSGATADIAIEIENPAQEIHFTLPKTQ